LQSLNKKKKEMKKKKKKRGKRETKKNVKKERYGGVKMRLKPNPRKRQTKEGQQKKSGN